MTTETDESTTNHIYELTCNDCAFEATVDGTPFEALDVADAHREEYGENPVDHFVDFEISGSR